MLTTQAANEKSFMLKEIDISVIGGGGLDKVQDATLALDIT